MTSEEPEPSIVNRGAGEKNSIEGMFTIETLKDVVAHIHVLTYVHVQHVHYYTSTMYKSGLHLGLLSRGGGL